MSTAPSIDRHNREIRANRACWESKPLLRKVYGDLYAKMLPHIRRDLDGAIVEIGSGIGHIKEVLPECVTTDLFPNPWIDRTENVYSLSFGDGEVSNIVLFHIFHHLRYPGTALAEMRRVLIPGGRIVLLEPYISLLGRVVYGRLHHEPVGLHDEIEWDAPAGFSPERDNMYYAAQGNATRVFCKGEYADRLDGWECVAVKRYAGFSYILSGGYSKPQLYPAWAHGAMRVVDRVFDAIPALSATCMVVVLEKR